MGEWSASRHVLDKIKEHVTASLRAAQLDAINKKTTLSGTNHLNGQQINFHRLPASQRQLTTNKNTIPTPPGSPLQQLTTNGLSWTTSSLPPPPPSSSSSDKNVDFLHVTGTTRGTNSSTNLQFPPSVVIGGHHIHHHQGTAATSQVVPNIETNGPSAALGVASVPSPLPGLSLINHHRPNLESPIIARALASSLPKRHRGEKHPTPEEQKDDKYFEKRKKNNEAAKKSRDARKLREDEIAFRANILEKENAILRAQVATLREEANSLRHLLMQKRHSRFQVL